MNGRAISKKAHWEFDAVRGYAPEEVDVDAGCMVSFGFKWVERLADGVHVYRYFTEYVG